MAGPTVTLTFAGDATRLGNTVREVEGQSDSLADKFDRNSGKITAAGAAGAAAVESFARSQAPLTEGLGRVSQATGIQSSELRGLAKETSNVTFPLDEVIGLMELGSQQGLESGESLQRYAAFWDTVGDATGENAMALGEAGTALRAVGIAAGDEEQALASFGYITQGTTQDVEGFLSFLERTGPQLREMGMDVDDSAALLGVLEHEFGMTGRTARSEFRSAVNDSDGDLNKMLDTLGVSEDQLATYRGEVEASGETIQGLADNHEESYTAIQRMKHWVDETLFSLGEYGDAAAALAIPLMAIGPIAKSVVFFFRLMGNTALINGAKMAAGWLLAMGPVGLIIIGIGLVVAAFLWLWNNVEGFRNFFLDAWEWIKSSASDAADWVRNTWNTAVAFFRSMPTIISGIFRRIGDGIRNAFRSAFNFVANAWNNTIGALSWTVPSWIPGIGGSTLSVPRLPTYHQGGTVAGRPGQEVLAILQAGERVTSASDVRAESRGGAGVVEFAGDVDSAFATAFMKLVRTGRIQVRAA